MLEVVTNGLPGTAMKGFASLLDGEEIAAVVYFVREIFIKQKLKNNQYHTAENGWINHERYRIAYPFALGELALDTPWESLSDELKQGKQLFLRSCVSCHDRAQVREEGVIWESRPLSFPRNGYSHKEGNVDAMSGASPFGLHEQDDGEPLELTNEERMGQTIFEQNCTFCHGKDGSGKNWIGSFIQPHPRNFSEHEFASTDIDRLQEMIGNGVAGTAMPAWKTVLSQAQIRAVAMYLTKKFMRK